MSELKINCKELVKDSDGFPYFPCSRNAFKDGYCKQHHPESVKARQKKSEERFKANEKKTDWYKLGQAQLRIEALELENAALKKRAEKMTLAAYTKSEELRAMTARAEKAEIKVEALEKEIAAMKIKANRWDEVLKHVGVESNCRDQQDFVLLGLDDSRVDFMKGSVVEHFTNAIDNKLRN